MITIKITNHKTNKKEQAEKVLEEIEEFEDEVKKYPILLSDVIRIIQEGVDVVTSASKYIDPKAGEISYSLKPKMLSSQDKLKNVRESIRIFKYNQTIENAENLCFDMLHYLDHTCRCESLDINHIIGSVYKYNKERGYYD